MKCQNCGNELGQNEVFCGQCGTPNTTTAQPTEMMQAPAPRSGVGNDGYRNRSSFSPAASQANQPFSPAASQANQAFSPAASQANQPFTPDNGLGPGPQQVSGFYQEATEMVSLVPGTPANYPQTAYPQQNFGGSMPGGYAGGQQQPQFLPGNYSNPTYPPMQQPMQSSFANNQYGQSGYNHGSGASYPEPKRNNVIMIVGIVCLVFAIITVGIFGALFVVHNNSNNQSPASVAQATKAPTATATATAIPTATPTATATATPTSVPTPTPDANFSWCTSCTQGGYLIEFPSSWSQGATTDSQGTQFTDPSQTDIYAAVKTPSGATSVNDLLSADASEFSSQNGYVAPTSTQNTTIAGTNWSYQTFTYESSNSTVEQVTIYATIYQNKGYIIEVQAPQDQYATISGQYFNAMTSRFQFVAPGQQ